MASNRSKKTAHRNARVRARSVKNRRSRPPGKPNKGKRPSVERSGRTGVPARVQGRAVPVDRPVPRFGVVGRASGRRFGQSRQFKSVVAFSVVAIVVLGLIFTTLSAFTPVPDQPLTP